MQGAYEGEPYQDFDIAYGHSKDLRPDLKQLEIGAGVQQNGLLLMGEVLAGNTSDRKWNPDVALRMKRFFDEHEFTDVIFVSDCAIVSGDSLENMTREGIQFISRLPENFALAGHLKETAFQKDQWHDLGAIGDGKGKTASYKTYSARRKIGSNRYSFLVAQSSALEKKKEKTLQKRIGKQQESLSKEARELLGQDFACIPDAQRALDKLQEKAARLGFVTEGAVETTVDLSYSHKGRPRKREQPTARTAYRASCSIGEIGAEYYERLRRMEPTFVLIYSIKKERNYDDRAVLTEYKQQITVENIFRFLKSPAYLSPVYLHKKGRIMALSYVFILALLVATYLEYRVRQNLKKLDEAVALPGGRTATSPPTKTIMEDLSFIKVEKIGDERFFPGNQIRRALDMVVFAGFEPEEVYLKPLPLCNPTLGP